MITLLIFLGFKFRLGMMCCLFSPLLGKGRHARDRREIETRMNTLSHDIDQLEKRKSELSLLFTLRGPGSQWVEKHRDTLACIEIRLKHLRQDVVYDPIVYLYQVEAFEREVVCISGRIEAILRDRSVGGLSLFLI